MSFYVPVILTVFSNQQLDDYRYLRDLDEEMRSLRRIFLNAEKQGLCKHIQLSQASLMDIVQVFREYRDQITIFHYAGHANSYHLLLQEADGYSGITDAKGLADFLGQQHGLVTSN